jgi:hypothetical protein
MPASSAGATATSPGLTATSPTPTGPTAKPLVATATLSVATRPVATEPVATLSHPSRTLAVRPLPAPEPHAALPAHVVASSAPYDLGPPGGLSGSGRARVAAVARRLKLSPKPAVGTRATKPKSVPTTLYGPPPAQTRLPTSAGGGIGSAAPPALAPVGMLALAFSLLTLGRLSLASAPWRSALLTSRLEHPD